MEFPARADGSEVCMGSKSPSSWSRRGVVVGWPPSTERRDDCCLDCFLSVPATQTANHASAARIIRGNS